MSRDELKDLATDQAVPKKKKMDVEKFFQQFNTLDMNNYGSWPWSVKITCWIFLFLVVAAIGYFLAISPKMDAINGAKASEQTLLNEYREKESKLRNLQQYKAQLEQMKAEFQQQLDQLPKSTEIPSLVVDINATGEKAGLKFKNIKLEPEVKQEFFIEQPITIQATGDYHSFGRFISNMAALQRIITMHDFTISATQATDKKSDIPVVEYALNARTYYYKDTDAESADAVPAASQPGGQQ